MTQSITADVLVVGAGPTGAHAATMMAKSGLKVALIDQKPRGKTGAQWINGVPLWMVKHAGLDGFRPNEIYGTNDKFTLIAPDNKTRISIHNFEGFDANMQLFGNRIIDKFCNQKNAIFLPETCFINLGFSGSDRPNRAVLQDLLTGKNITITSKLFVDAAGLKSPVKHGIALLRAACARLERADICTSAQMIHEISDKHGARAYLEKTKAEPDELLSFIGVAGGFSLLRPHISKNLDQVAILTGSIAVPEYRSGKQILDDFVAENKWIGKKILGGTRAIPLRRPYTRLSAAGVALLGDAACQVYSAHGSGIGIGLIAANMLASTVVEAQKKGEDIGSAEVLHRYTYEFHTQFGGLLGTSDAFRRMSQRLPINASSRLMASGLLTCGLLENTLLQKNANIRLADLPRQIFGAIRRPILTGKFLPVLAKFPLINRCAKRYPADVNDVAALNEYERRMSLLIS